MNAGEGHSNAGPQCRWGDRLGDSERVLLRAASFVCAVFFLFVAFPFVFGVALVAIPLMLAADGRIPSDPVWWRRAKMTLLFLVGIAIDLLAFYWIGAIVAIWFPFAFSRFVVRVVDAWIAARQAR